MGTCFEDAQERKRLYSERGKELNRLLALPFKEKLPLSIETIKEALTYERPVIASSFGKDSIALTHLVHSVDNTPPVIFIDTRVGVKETNPYREMLTKLWNLTVYVKYPETTFWKVAKEKGLPKQSRNSKTGDVREPPCCKELKINPMLKFYKEYKPGMVFVGLTGGEGRQRRWAYILKGNAVYHMKAHNVMKCIPMIWWTQEDVWHYIKINKIPVNPAYEKYGIERLGCVPCTGFRSWETEMPKINPKMYKLIKKKILEEEKEAMEEVGQKTVFDTFEELL